MLVSAVNLKSDQTAWLYGFLQSILVATLWSSLEGCNQGSDLRLPTLERPPETKSLSNCFLVFHYWKLQACLYFHWKYCCLELASYYVAQTGTESCDLFSVCWDYRMCQHACTLFIFLLSESYSQHLEATKNSLPCSLIHSHWQHGRLFPLKASRIIKVSILGRSLAQ